MEFFSKAFFGLFQRLLPVGKPQREIQTSRTDAYLNAIYKVLVWDNPKISFLTLGLLHVILWLIVQLEMRFYGVIFLISLLVFLCDLCLEKCDVKAERSPSSDAMRQVGHLLKSALTNLRKLRNDEPSLFCLTMCGIFLCLILIAKHISGFAFAYLILLMIFTCPLMVSRIPPDYLTNFKEIVNTMGSDEGLLAEAELLPFIENKDFSDNEADLESSLTDRTADSVPNSLIYGMTSMPSYLDAEGGSLDGLEEEDLEFTMRPQKNSAVSYTPGEISSDSDSDHKSMSFESSHFNGDSSSEEEQRYAKGLRFTEVTRDVSDSKLQSPPAELGILGNITSLGTSLVANMFKSTAADNSSKRKNSDSDFEIIDSNEINDS